MFKQFNKYVGDIAYTSALEDRVRFTEESHNLLIQLFSEFKKEYDDEKSNADFELIKNINIKKGRLNVLDTPLFSLAMVWTDNQSLIIQSPKPFGIEIARMFRLRVPFIVNVADNPEDFPVHEDYMGTDEEEDILIEET